MHNARYYKGLFFLLSSFFVALLLISPEAQTDSAKKILDKEEEIREQMLKITQELGVTCVACHEVNDFKKASKPHFQIAKEHMKVVQLLNGNGFDGKHGPQASCFMCHRGKLKPDYNEALLKKALKKEAP